MFLKMFEPDVFKEVELLGKKLLFVGQNNKCLNF